MLDISEAMASSKAASALHGNAAVLAAFFDAVRTGSLAQVQASIVAGQDVNIANAGGSASLSIAAVKGHLEVC